MDLACNILDGAPFRDDISKTLTVQPAKFEMHGDQYVPKKKQNKNKKKKVNKVEKMLGWGGFDDLKNPTLVQSSTIGRAACKYPKRYMHNGSADTERSVGIISYIRAEDVWLCRSLSS